MTRRKILVFTAGNLCRNPRVVKEATTLGESGYDVSVLSLSLGSRFDELDRALTKSLPFTHVVHGHDRGKNVARLRNRAVTWLARNSLRYLRVESAWALGPTGPLAARALQIPADLIIAHSEIPLCTMATLIRHGRRVAVDIEDWYSHDLLPADRRCRPLAILRRAERYALHHAAYASTTSHSLASALAKAYASPTPHVIRNTFPLPPRSRLDRQPGSELPAFVWMSQTIGPGRGLEQFFAAWGRTPPTSRVALIGDHRPGYREKFLSLVPPQKRNLVSWIAPVPPGELPDLLTRFDVGLALEPSSPPSRDLTITNKLFQYMSAGLAIVATDTTGQMEILRATPDCGQSVILKDTGQLTHVLTEMVSDLSRLRAHQAAARCAAERSFSWHHDAEILRKVVAMQWNDIPLGST